MEISDFSKWWNRNQPVIEDGFMAPVMLNASRVAQMAFDAGVASEKAHATTINDNMKLPTYEDSEAKVHYRYDHGEGANAIERFICEYEPVMDDMEREKWREMLAAAISDYLPQGKGVEP